MPDRRRRPPSGRARRIVAWAAAAYAVGLVAFTVVRAVVEIRSGPLAYVAILESHLFPLLVPLTLAVVWARLPRPAGIVAAALAVGLLRLGSEWLSLPPSGGADDFTVMSWNLHIGSRPAEESVAQLLLAEADVIAIQELTDDVAAALAADPDIEVRFPFRELAPGGGTQGMGVLSRFPMRDARSYANPAGQEVVVETLGGDVTIVNAHPLPAVIAPPFTFDPARRDRAIATARGWADAALGRDETVVLIGDFNVTPTEPAYRRLVDGLRDAHTDAGLGPGWTWRPKRVEPFGIGALRIDYVFVGPGLAPVSSSVDCPHVGDHCRVLARIGFE